MILSAPVCKYWTFISVTITPDFRKLLFSCTFFFPPSLTRYFFLHHSCHSCKMKLSMSAEPVVGVLFLESSADLFYRCRMQFDLAALSSGCSAKVYLHCHCSLQSLQLLILQKISKILEDMLYFILRLKTGIYRCGDQTSIHRKPQQGCLTETYFKK